MVYWYSQCKCQHCYIMLYKKETMFLMTFIIVVKSYMEVSSETSDIYTERQKARNYQRKSINILVVTFSFAKVMLLYFGFCMDVWILTAHTRSEWTMFLILYVQNSFTISIVILASHEFPFPCLWSLFFCILYYTSDCYCWTGILREYQCIGTMNSYC